MSELKRHIFGGKKKPKPQIEKEVVKRHQPGDLAKALREEYSDILPPIEEPEPQIDPAEIKNALMRNSAKIDELVGRVEYMTKLSDKSDVSSDPEFEKTSSNFWERVQDVELIMGFRDESHDIYSHHSINEFEDELNNASLNTMITTYKAAHGNPGVREKIMYKFMEHVEYDFLPKLARLMDASKLFGKSFDSWATDISKEREEIKKKQEIYEWMYVIGWVVRRVDEGKPPTPKEIEEQKSSVIDKENVKFWVGKVIDKIKSYPTFEGKFDDYMWYQQNLGSAIKIAEKDLNSKEYAQVVEQVGKWRNEYLKDNEENDPENKQEEE